jgi:hypothetical protein
MPKLRPRQPSEISPIPMTIPEISSQRLNGFTNSKDVSPL